MDRPQLLALIFALPLLAGAALAGAAEPDANLWKRDVDSAWRLAKQSRRPLVLLFTTDGCVHCEKMSREISSDRVVAKDLADGFVSAIVHSSEHPALVRKLGIVAFPTTVIVSPDAKVMDAVEGYLPPAELHGRLRTARVARTPG